MAARKLNYTINYGLTVVLDNIYPISTPCLAHPTLAGVHMTIPVGYSELDEVGQCMCKALCQQKYPRSHVIHFIRSLEPTNHETNENIVLVK